MTRPGRRDEFEHPLWGAGTEALFPGDQPMASVPFRQAAKSKKRSSYDADLVRKTVTTAPTDSDIVDIDPRSVKATQPMVTRAGVEYYSSGRYEKTGETFADKANPGNQWPIVYRRPTMRDPAVTEDVLLTGHHRGTAALLHGTQFKGRLVEGEWGAPRKTQ